MGKQLHIVGALHTIVGYEQAAHPSRDLSPPPPPSRGTQTPTSAAADARLQLPAYLNEGNMQSPSPPPLPSPPPDLRCMVVDPQWAILHGKNARNATAHPSLWGDSTDPIDGSKFAEFTPWDELDGADLRAVDRDGVYRLYEELDYEFSAM